MNLRVHRIFCVTLLVSSMACRTWRTQSAPTEVTVADAGSGPIRVVRKDHSVIELRQASIAGDSLVGYAGDREKVRVAMPLSDVSTVSTREVSGGRTAGLAGGVLLGLVALTGILAAIALTQIQY